MYLNGLGVKQDAGAAFICLREAASRGNVYAMGNLVSHYYKRKLYTKGMELAARLVECQSIACIFFFVSGLREHYVLPHSFPKCICQLSSEVWVVTLNKKILRTVEFCLHQWELNCSQQKKKMKWTTWGKLVAISIHITLLHSVIKLLQSGLIWGCGSDSQGNRLLTWLHLQRDCFSCLLLCSLFASGVGRSKKWGRSKEILLKGEPMICLRDFLID